MSNPVTFVQFPSTGDAMNAVADRSVDAGCMVDLDGFGVPLPEGVVVDVIGLEPVVVILPAGHPRAGQDRVGLADLADETWLLPPYDAGCDDYGALADACAPAGFAPPGCHPSGSVTWVSSACADSRATRCSRDTSSPRTATRPSSGPARSSSILSGPRSRPAASPRAEPPGTGVPPRAGRFLWRTGVPGSSKRGIIGV
ncbi:LysR substrate-binding domain-containing protein [Streptomyces rubiginosohelvolus]|uniref:LysR substrate-binding domain-containing protein n=1 Tax=Streptomyces rubiginosohelvolus TaxID=67362 RepID=UPI0036FE9FDB